MKLQVEVGTSKKQIIAGIAQSYNPEDLVNKKVVVVSNLAPAKLFGELSEGMILAVEHGKGKMKVLEVDQKIDSGTEVR